jgi:MoaA/NifB/PqqE/SkfB family radical SAM enzyme
MTGGEVTLHPRFGDIIDLIVSKGYRFHFVTNGTTIGHVFKRIGRYAGGPYWNGVSISLDGACEDTHDAIRGAGVFRKTMAAIATCRAKKLPVTVQMVVNRLNRHEMDAMAKLCTLMQVSRLFYCHMQPTPHGLRDDIFLPPDEWGKIDAEVLKLKQMYRIPIQQAAGYYDLQPLSHCKFLRNGALNIDYRGRLTICCQLSNTGGPDDQERDVVADLNRVSLTKAHMMLMDAYNDIHKARLIKIGEGTMTKADSFHCWFCLKHFKKLTYMKNHLNNPWVKQDDELHQELAGAADDKAMPAYQS